MKPTAGALFPYRDFCCLIVYGAEFFVFLVLFIKKLFTSIEQLTESVSSTCWLSSSCFS